MFACFYQVYTNMKKVCIAFFLLYKLCHCGLGNEDVLQEQLYANFPGSSKAVRTKSWVSDHDLIYWTAPFRRLTRSTKYAIRLNDVTEADENIQVIIMHCILTAKVVASSSQSKLFYIGFAIVSFKYTANAETFASVCPQQLDTGDIAILYINSHRFINFLLYRILSNNTKPFLLDLLVYGYHTKETTCNHRFLTLRGQTLLELSRKFASHNVVISETDQAQIIINPPCFSFFHHMSPQTDINSHKWSANDVIWETSPKIEK